MEKSISYQIYGIKGDVIQSGNFDESHSDLENIDLHQIPNGTYILHLRNDSQHLAAHRICLLYTSPSPRDGLLSRMPSSA